MSHVPHGLVPVLLKRQLIGGVGPGAGRTRRTAATQRGWVRRHSFLDRVAFL